MLLPRAVFLLVLAKILSLVSASTERSWDYIIVGAGPAGLQLGHYLERAGRDYVILERGNVSGDKEWIKKNVFKSGVVELVSKCKIRIFYCY